MTLPSNWSLAGDYYIPLRLQLLTRMIEREMSRQMHALHRISVAEWRVLALSCSRGTVSAADVAAAFEADPGQVSRAVASLLRSGLLERQSQPGNRKKKTLSPTARGRAVFDELHIKRRDYYNCILGDLSPAEREAFDRALTVIAQRVDEQRVPDDAP